MELIKQAKFGNLMMDFYKDETGDIFATRKQIGECLMYSNPQKAIDNLHERKKDRLDKFSVTLSLRGADNKQYDTSLYNARGITEICRWARTDNADDFFDWVTEVIEGIHRDGLYVSDEATHEQVKFNVSNFMANLDDYNITKLYNLIEEFLAFHRQHKTRLPYKRKNSKHHGNKKLKDHIDSMEDIRNELVSFLDVKIQQFNDSRQAGLAQEYVRIKGMVEWKVENMRYRTAACR
ncbi:BRO family protein [Paenibacillus amylolyticus]|uniref:BRO family protein n=1 Tax=Paenibacillus amylolyticus TaxID=1451 RepID=UPI003F7EDB02